MHILTSQADAHTAPAARSFHAAPWAAVAGLATALALVAWAGSGPDTGAPAAALECRISHPAGNGNTTTVMLVNVTPHTLPAGTVWAWSPAGGDPQGGEQRVLTAPLANGGAVLVQSAVPAVALRCRAALVATPPFG